MANLICSLLSPHSLVITIASIRLLSSESRSCCVSGGANRANLSRKINRWLSAILSVTYYNTELVSSETAEKLQSDCSCYSSIYLQTSLSVTRTKARVCDEIVTSGSAFSFSQIVTTILCIRTSAAIFNALLFFVHIHTFFRQHGKLSLCHNVRYAEQTCTEVYENCMTTSDKWAVVMGYCLIDVA